MASFGWKKKVGEKVSKSTVLLFESEAEKKTKSIKTKAVGDDDEEEADWLHATKRRRETLLEDCTAKSKRLKDEGAFLAQQGRHGEAIKKWDEAIQLTPDNASLYEMKSQVLTILQEVFPAVKAAEMAVKCRPVWWEGWQTLGRAQVNMGEVDLAVRSFQVAVHLCPSERALWQDDLAWAQRLQRQRRDSQEKRQREEEAREQVLDAPELQRDYDDFESDEVLAACTAVAERQRRYEEMKERTIVVVLDADGNVREEDADAAASVSTLVKARGP